MRQRFLVPALATLSFLSPVLAFAQSGTTTGTGTVIVEDPAVWEARELRIEGFSTAASAFEKAEVTFVAQEKNRRQKLNDHRRDCTESIRKANRDTKFSVTLQCYRTDLTLIRDIVEKQKEYVEDIPGVTENVRAQTLMSATKLLDAIATIMQAIEAGVYATENDLLEAKNNLLTKYRVPYADALFFTRVDRTETWIIRLLVQLHSYKQEISESIDLEQISEAMECFEVADITVKSLLLDRSAESRATFRQEQTHLKSCGEMVKKLAELNTKIDQ